MFKKKLRKKEYITKNLCLCEIRNIDKIEYLGAGTYEKYFSSTCTYRICWLKNSEFVDVFTGSSYRHMAGFLVDSGEPVVYRYEFFPFITEKVSESELLDYFEKRVKKLTGKVENTNNAKTNTKDSQAETDSNVGDAGFYGEEIEK